jgi:hypothetical protein
MMQLITLGLLFCRFSAMAEPITTPPGEDAISTSQIREHTTDEKFLTRWVDHVPEHSIIPSPRDFLVYSIGTPGELTQVEQIHAYFRKLEETSPLIKVVSIGSSHEGREMLLAIIADEATLANLERYRGYLQQLADPRQVDQGQADEIIEKAKPIFWMTAGLHSPELGPPEMVMELAYRMVVETRAPFSNIRDKVITMITPVVEVDGRARQVDWFHQHQKGRTDYYDRPPSSVPFWGHYTYHDNNRDGISISQALTRNYTQGVYNWLPTISLDLHESVPFLYVAGGTGPYSPAVSPITIGEWQALSNYELSRLSGMGLEGVWTWGYYTGWYPGYLLWTTNNHNAMGRFYETFGNGSSETMARDIKQSSFAGEKTTKKTWYRPSPPPRQFTWSMRNNTNYMQTGVIASLEMVANSRDMFLTNFYKKGADALNAYKDYSIKGFVIPQEQKDRNGANYLVEVLTRHAIEIERATSKGKFGEVEVAKGDLVIKLNQPYGPLAKTLLENQKFPEKVQVPPYDDVAWTLGLAYGADVKSIKDPSLLTHATEVFEGQFLAPVKVKANARYLAVANVGQAELGPLRYALGADVMVQMTDEHFEHGGQEFASGSLIISLDNENRQQVAEVVQRYYSAATALRKLPKVNMHVADLPRLAVLHSWISTQNAGWVRYSLDEAGVPFTLLAKDELHEGALRSKYDAIIVPAFRGKTAFKDVLAGVDPKWSPLAYERSEQTPNLGHMLSSPDITGGLGFAGMAELEKFVADGGLLMTFGSGGIVAVESGMTTGISVKRPSGLNSPGSFLTAKVMNTGSPLVYGYGDMTYVFRNNQPIFGVKDYQRDWVSLQFGVKDYTKDDSDKPDSKPDDARKKEKLVISGGIIEGIKLIDGEPALLSRKLGQGNLVIFNWNPMHRDVNRHDHGFVYNALMSWNDL